MPLYFMARWYRGKYKNRIAQNLLNLLLHPKRLQNDYPKTATAVLVCNALMRLGLFFKYSQLITQQIQFLLTKQNADGSWSAVANCIDFSINGQRQYAGSSASTTALVVECLALYQTYQTQVGFVKKLKIRSTKINLNAKANTKINDKGQINPNQIKNEILAKINHRLINTPPILKTQLEAELNHIIHHFNSHFILLSPFYFAKSYLKNNELNSKLLTTLGLANVWGWLGYTLLNKFTDQKQIQPKKLPLAIFAIHEFANIYTQQFNNNSAFLLQLNQVIATINTAVVWELSNARAKISQQVIFLPKKFPQYTPITIIAEKSLGHALGGLAIIYSHQKQAYYQTAQFWLEFMHRQLAVKQLNDDLHDWEDDLQNGLLSPVVSLVLQTFSQDYPALIKHQKLELTAVVWQKLRLVFWQKSLPSLIELASQQINLTRSLLKNEASLINKDFLHHSLDRLEKNNHKTLYWQNLAIEFIEHY
jgi:hypothetical protein